MPDDPELEKIDHNIWLWMYYSWLEDINEKHEFSKQYAIFSGSFINPEAANKMIKSSNPDYELSEEEFDESTRRMLEENRREEQPSSLHRRKKRKKTVIN